MPEAWSNDLFISYSSADRAWAARLHASLKAADPARRIFFDNTSLRAGDDWEARIEGALDATRHFVLLWSDQASQSDWVKRELFHFMALAKPKLNPHRRLICINLQGANTGTKVFQQITVAALQAEYLNPAAAAPAAWQEAMQSVEDGLDPNRRPLEVPMVVLTLTSDQLALLEPDALSGIAQDFGLADAALAQRYGPARDDWRPFDGSRTIAQILHEMRLRLNAGLPDRALVWRAPPPEFWSGNIKAAQEFVNTTFKAGELSVLVVDPVAIHRHAVYQRLMLFQDRLGDDHATILTLPPFAPSASVLGLRSALMTTAVPYFDHYFKSTAPPHHHVAAQCGWNVSDADEMRRLILAAADDGSTAAARAPVEGLEYVSQQPRRP